MIRWKLASGCAPTSRRPFAAAPPFTWVRRPTGPARVDAHSRTTYIRRVVRIQLCLDEAVHRRLQALARGRSISAMVRDALVNTYGPGADEREATLKGIYGLGATGPTSARRESS